MMFVFSEASSLHHTELSRMVSSDQENRWLSSLYQDADLWEEEDKSGKHHTLVASNNANETIGFVTVKFFPKTVEAAVEYYVSPAHRGKHHGVQLLAEMKRFVKNRTRHAVVLVAAVASDNTASMKTIEHAGFLPNGYNFKKKLYTCVVHSC